MELPILYPVRQKFEGSTIPDIETKVKQELKKANFLKNMQPGARIAVTAGSRGISGIVPILRTVCDVLKQQRLEPFLVPAMGSHGGGTPEGQKQMLQRLGITEETIGVPIQATADAVQIGQLSDGTPVYQNRIAYESDGILVVNRVKQHTSFKSQVESGLCKMIVVGLGNPKGAANIHRFGVRGLREEILPMAQVALGESPIVYGMAILENAHEQVADIVGLEPSEIPEQEPRLLQRAKEMFPRLPFEQIDLLIVEEMGKSFSGTGMDTNVIGRQRIHGEPEPETPQIKRVVVLDLTDASHGNANGIGLADFTTRKLVDKIDWQATYLNILSTGFVQRGMVPVTASSDQEAVTWAIRSLGERDVTRLRITKIMNTLQLEQIWISAALLDEAKHYPNLEIIGEGVPLSLS